MVGVKLTQRRSRGPLELQAMNSNMCWPGYTGFWFEGLSSWIASRATSFLSPAGVKKQKNRSFSFPGMASHSLPGLWLGLTWGLLLCHSACKPGAVLHGCPATPSWDPKGASHHFKSVPLSYLADSLRYLVLWFLILPLRDRERAGC